MSKEIDTTKKRKIGRPRSLIPETDELIALGQEMVEWATEETKEQRFMFPQFYCLLKGYTEDQFDKMKRTKEFWPYYEQSRVALCEKLLLGKLKEGFVHRLLRVYCIEVRRVEDEVMREKVDYEASKKLQTPPNDEKIDLTIDLLKENLKLKQEKDELKRKTDSKLPAGD